MPKKTHLAALLLGAVALASPLAWAQENSSATENSGSTLSTKKLKEQKADRSGWIGFDEATKKLKDAGYGQILLLKQTGKGYFARTRDNEGMYRHVFITPKGDLNIKTQYTKGKRRGHGPHHGQHGRHH